ncbi:MAG: monovalent cation/H+ antiporter complex subunit F [Promicromonosporaceae bacterium]|nr:monovalent cation/H+ antiporter complex subunit F [Promicromonosporaceae bacterium]
MSFLEVIMVIIVLSAVVSALAMVKGQSRWNRLLGYNLVAGKVTMAIMLLAATSENTFYLDIAIVYSLLSFIGVTALSDYLVEDGTRDVLE